MKMKDRRERSGVEFESNEKAIAAPNSLSIEAVMSQAIEAALWLVHASKRFTSRPPLVLPSTSY